MTGKILLRFACLACWLRRTWLGRPVGRRGECIDAVHQKYGVRSADAGTYE